MIIKLVLRYSPTQAISYLSRMVKYRRKDTAHWMIFCIKHEMYRIQKIPSLAINPYNLFVTSKNETMSSPIHEFEVLQKGQRAFQKPFLTVYYLLSITLKKIKPCFFTLKALKEILYYFEFMNW